MTRVFLWPLAVGWSVVAIHHVGGLFGAWERPSMQYWVITILTVMAAWELLEKAIKGKL